MNLRDQEIRQSISNICQANAEEWGVILAELENQAELNKQETVNKQFWRAMQVQILNLRRNMGFIVPQ
jgi:hypothetical protein